MAFDYIQIGRRVGTEREERTEREDVPVLGRSPCVETRGEERRAKESNGEEDDKSSDKDESDDETKAQKAKIEAGAEICILNIQQDFLVSCSCPICIYHGI